MEKAILLLEDNELEAKNLKKMIRSYSQKIQIFSATNLVQANEFINSDTIFDVFFLDISLSSDNINQAGLDFATTLSSTPRYKDTPILFITAFPEHIYYALNQLHCFAYMLKPYTKKDVHYQLRSLFDTTHTILLKTLDNIHIQIPLDTLQYIESNGRYLTFTTNSTSYCSRQYTLKKLLQILPAEFIRCHKSYIINQTFVKNYDFVNHFVHMVTDNKTIPLSRTFHC